MGIIRHRFLLLKRGGKIGAERLRIAGAFDARKTRG
jgi:hypothetical protein